MKNRIIKQSTKYFSNTFEENKHKFSNFKSCLFVPGNQEKMLKKSYDIKTNILVPDLEDSVPPNEKINGRKMIMSHLLNMSKGV